MPGLEQVRENLRFMTGEVRAQVELTRRFFSQPGQSLVEKINARDDYIDNQKSLIEQQTFDRLMEAPRLEKTGVAELRAINTIAANLERIGDFAVNMLRQTGHLSDFEFVRRFNFDPFLEVVLKGLERVVPALNRRSASLAFKICRCEFNLDELHAANFARVLRELDGQSNRGDLITVLFISHYLERMGDCLLNIGEAFIFALVGEKMKIHQYQALRDTLACSGLDTPIGQVEFESIWGTRSGCRIAAVQQQSAPDSARPVLFKQGNKKKLLREKENLELWDKLAPGLPPKVWAFQDGENTDGAILLEYLPGCNMQDMVITGDEEGIIQAERLLEETLGEVWQATKRDGSCSAGFAGQITARREAVYRLHPALDLDEIRIGRLRIPGFNRLLAGLAKVEEELASPFSVQIHGDMNLNNVIYNPAENRIHFIDLHRSCRRDYAQDASVFLVSNYRLPVFERDVRNRIKLVIKSFMRFAFEFARQNQDHAFQARLALGLARSLFSSTRFEMNRDFVNEMHQRAVYLMERLASHRGDWASFTLPTGILL